MLKRERFTELDLAKYVITSKEMAEVFIKRWMEQHNTTRDNALAKLKELGIELSRLRDKH